MTIILSIFLPIICGSLMLKVKFKNIKALYGSVFTIVLLNAVISIYSIIFYKNIQYVFFEFTDNLKMIFRIDSLSSIFGTMVSVLWIFTTVYALEYMKHEKNEQKFFSFFIMSFGVVLGIAFAANFFTLYIFYEFLTLSTIPLVIHSMNKQSNYAGYLYIIFMLIGAALAFVGFIFLNIYSGNQAFAIGGFVNLISKQNMSLIRSMFFITFMGFGVKAAMIPFTKWLPAASVAPTPVTALLHAVAVVKAGVFSMIRLLYYCYGTKIISGSMEQKVIMILALCTIIYGSVMALRTQHIKRRFAYSTISNLSYIVFGIILCSYEGLTAGILHMLYHAVIKITLFFTAGAILYMTGKEHLNEISGLAKKMPITFAVMAVTGLSLVGVPPLGAFFSKWYLSYAAIKTGECIPLFGVLILIISEILTALYCFTILKQAYFLQTDKVQAEGKDPNYLMIIPMVLLSALAIIMAFCPNILLEWAWRVVSTPLR